MRIHLWSSPRNISTALMYAFSRHPLVKVVDEPLYGHYLLHQPTAANHPGRQEIINDLDCNADRVIDQLLRSNIGDGHLLCKQMTHHLTTLNAAQRSRILGLDAEVRTAKPQLRNVLLIRDPRAILHSFSKVVDNVTANDIGIPQQHALFHELRSRGRLAAVVDARKLLLRPKEVLEKLCATLEIGFYESMLSWPAGPIPEDGIWAKYWYANVHRSTGFQPYQEKELLLSPELEAIAGSLKGAYEEMLAAAL
jgi:hypothetical protein